MALNTGGDNADMEHNELSGWNLVREPPERQWLVEEPLAQADTGETESSTEQVVYNPAYGDTENEGDSLSTSEVPFQCFTRLNIG